jgi:uncharacterized protein (DUF58 family)
LALITRRFLIVLLLAAPLIAGGNWIPALEWVGAGYALAVCALGVLDWRLGAVRALLEPEREHDQRLSLGADNLIQVHVRSRAGRALRLWLRDEAPDEFVVDRRTLDGTAPAHGVLTLTYHVRPVRRGDYQFRDINLRWLCPLGLVIRQARYPAAAGVKVYPNLLDVRKYDLLLKRNQLYEMGLRHTRNLGRGTEFERLREYQHDDEYRRIDWAATARRGKPIVREFETERSQTVVAVLDAGRLMRSPVGDMAKLDYAINAVLLLAYVATGKGDKLGLLAFADEVQRYLAPRQGRPQFYRMLEALHGVSAQAVEPDFVRALSYLAVKVRRRSLIVIFTDLSSGQASDALVGQVAALRPRHLPLVVTISDPAVVDRAGARPAAPLDVYQRAAAERLLDERAAVLETLRRRGVLTLDVPAASLSIEVVQRYLDLKSRMKL